MFFLSTHFDLEVENGEEVLWKGAGFPAGRSEAAPVCVEGTRGFTRTMISTHVSGCGVPQGTANGRRLAADVSSSRRTSSLLLQLAAAITAHVVMQLLWANEACDAFLSSASSVKLNLNGFYADLRGEKKERTVNTVNDAAA